MEEKENPYLFIPRVPVYGACVEDRTIPRICLSTSIETCIQAIAYGNRDIRPGSKFRIFYTDISLDDPNLKYPEDIVDKVPDSIINNEYWYTDNLLMKYTDNMIMSVNSHKAINKEIYYKVYDSILADENLAPLATYIAIDKIEYI
jgi:hypothetical protein